MKIPIGSKTVQVEQVVGEVKTMVATVVPWIEFDLGLIIGAVIGFLITAAVVFFVIVKPANKLMSLMKKEEAAAPAPAPAADIVLLTEIRDLLKK